MTPTRARARARVCCCRGRWATAAGWRGRCSSIRRGGSRSGATCPGGQSSGAGSRRPASARLPMRSARRGRVSMLTSASWIKSARRRRRLGGSAFRCQTSSPGQQRAAAAAGSGASQPARAAKPSGFPRRAAARFVQRRRRGWRRIGASVRPRRGRGGQWSARSAWRGRIWIRCRFGRRWCRVTLRRVRCWRRYKGSLI